MKTKTFVLIGICAGLLFGCGEETTSPPVTNASPGGFWEGIDSNGGHIIALVTETGKFHFIDGDLNQGSGTLSVSDTNDVDSNFHFVTQPGSTFADGTTSANCSLAGTVSERQTMTVTVACMTAAGLHNQITAALSNKALYERASSLATIAGNYQGLKEVLNIAGDGTLFSQNPGTGCVANGQVSIIDNAFNAYDFEFTYSNCVGQAAVMNGSSFVGIASLDNSVTPEKLLVAAIGDMDGDVPSFEGNFISFVQTLERL